jgi:hypothetical protein
MLARELDPGSAVRELLNGAQDEKGAAPSGRHTA